jgi:serine/threonine protein kinase
MHNKFQMRRVKQF